MSEADNHLIILSELEKKARRAKSRHDSSHSMRYSSKRRSRRDNILIMSSKSLGSHGNSTETTMSRRSLGSDSSSYQSSSESPSGDALSASSRERHLSLMDELQEKIARMNALSSATHKPRSGNNWRHSSRRCHGSSRTRSSSLSSSERSGGSVGSEGSGKSGQSSRRSSRRGTKQEYSRRRSSSSGSASGSRTKTPRDDPPTLPTRTRRSSSPEKTGEPSKLASQQASQSLKRRSPPAGVGTANGSLQVTQCQKLSLSSPSSSSRDGAKARGRRYTRSSHRSGNRNNSAPDVATVDSEGDPLEDISVPGAFSVHSSGQISLLSSSSHHRSSSISLDGSVQSTSVSSLSSASSHFRQSLDDSSRSVSSSSSSSSSHRRRDKRNRRSSRRRRHLDSSTRSSSSQHSGSRSLQSWPEEKEEEDEDDDHSIAGNTSVTSRSVLMSVNEEPEETAIAASVAQDFQEELEEARAQGRREALNEVTRQNSDEIIVAIARNEDEDSLASEVVDEKRKKKVLCWAFLLCCLALFVGIGATALLFFGKENGLIVEPIINEEDSDSNLKGVIIFTPPTPEECEAIANGTILEDQMSLIQRSFDIQIDITLGSDADFGSLLSDLMRHIQQKLLPVMAGCQAIDFFDATIAITDGITATNATGAITNGQVKESKEAACEFDPIGNCKSFVLILDLYLEEDKSNAILLETIGGTVTSEDIVNALGDHYPIQGVTDPSIELLIDDTTTAPAPGQDYIQDSETSSPMVSSTSAPTVDQTGSYTPRPTAAPTVINVYPENPTATPTGATLSPSRSFNTPTGTPTKGATSSPTKSPSKSPTKAPTKSPTARPTDAPVTSSPTPSPTRSPSPPPTSTPTRLPTLPPTKAPTTAPTDAPTLGSFCCSKNFITCSGVDPICQTSQAACQACNEAVWIQQGSCTTGLGRNDDCSDNESGCCAGTCVPFGNTKQCRL